MPSINPKKLLLPTRGVLLCMLAVTNALLIRQNLQMRTELNKFKPDTLQVGQTVPSFSAQGLNGEPLSVNYGAGEPTRVLLFLSVNCKYCHEQFPMWREIIKRADRNHFVVLALVSKSENKDKLEEYLRSVDCAELPVVKLPDNVRNSYKLSGTPTTLVISSNGKVEQMWYGKWNSDVIAVASTTFGLSFSTP